MAYSVPIRNDPSFQGFLVSPLPPKPSQRLKTYHTPNSLLQTAVVFDTWQRHWVTRQWGKVMAQPYGSDLADEKIRAVKAISYLCILRWLPAKVVTGAQLGPLKRSGPTPVHTPTSSLPSAPGFISCPQTLSNLTPAAPWFAKLLTTLKAVFLQQVYA